MEPVATDIFKIKSSAVCHSMMILYGKPWLVCIIFILLPLVILGVFLDLRWIIVALMLLFIVLPMMMAFLFFYYGLNKVSVINSAHHRLEFGKQEITALIFAKAPPSSSHPEDKTANHTDADNAPEFEQKSSSSIAYSSITDYIVGSSSIILRTKTDGKGFLLIPLSVFQSKNNFIKAIAFLTQGMRSDNYQLKS